ncbi:MAG: hypothetical protein ABEJ77_03985 [Halanaeroarchaeum sp.]
MDDGEISEELRNRMEKYGGGGSGTLAVDPREASVGDDLLVRGRDLDPGTEYALRWRTNEGEWSVIAGHEVVGPQYHPLTETIGSVTTDEDGAFDYEWIVPEDFGGGHRIELVRSEETVATAEITVVPHFEIERTTVPMGETIAIHAHGVSTSVDRSNFQIAWDQGYTGLVTGVRKRGSATAHVRAAGPPGEHVLQVWRNYNGVPYVTNNTQSPMGPVAGGRQSKWIVEVTEPETPPDPVQVEAMDPEEPLPVHYPNLDEDTDASLTVSPQSGRAGTQIVIQGRDFPANETVDLRWYQHVGEGIRSATVEPKPRPDVLPTVETDARGSFTYETEVPTAEGSTRPIVAAVDGREVAVTGFMVQPDVERFEPVRGPVGETMTIELSGIGWTNYESTPTFVYDNHYLGYGCGMTDDYRSTTVRTELDMAGQPGWHFIDVYPSLFRMEDEEPRVEMYPHLSTGNHPVRRLPVLRLAFEITE